MQIIPPPFLWTENPYFFWHLTWGFVALVFAIRWAAQPCAALPWQHTFVGVCLLSFLGLQFDSQQHALIIYGSFTLWAWCAWLSCTRATFSLPPLSSSQLVVLSYLGYWLLDLFGTLWLEVSGRLPGGVFPLYWAQILPSPYSPSNSPPPPEGWIWWIGGAGLSDGLILYPLALVPCLWIADFAYRERLKPHKA